MNKLLLISLVFLLLLGCTQIKTEPEQPEYETLKDGQFFVWETDCNCWEAKYYTYGTPTGAIDFGALTMPIVTTGTITGSTGYFDSLQQIDYIDLNTSYSNGSSEGRLQWNSDDGTLEFGLPGGNVNLQVGQEEVIRCKAAEDIDNGEVVYISGASGSRPECSLAIANDFDIAHHVVGVATEDISSGQNGYITSHGLVRDINTSGFSVGSEVYLSASSAGGFTSSKPVSPNYIVHVGDVVVSNANNGVLFIHVHSDEWENDLNVLNDAVVGGDLNVTGNAWFDSNTHLLGYAFVHKMYHAYGGFEDSGYTIPLTQNVWTQVTNADNNLWEGSEADGMTIIDDNLVVFNAADYSGSVSLSFSGGQSNDYEFRFYHVTDDTQEGFAVDASTFGNGNNVNITLPVYFELGAGDVVSLQVRNVTDNDDIILKSGVFEVHYLHD